MFAQTAQNIIQGANNLFHIANCYTVEGLNCYSNLKWENNSHYVYIKFLGVAHFLTWLANNHIIMLIIFSELFCAL